MSDITTIWTGTHGDWSISGPMLANGNDLATSVLISLFTDRVASDDDKINDGSKDPRGWWGDDEQNKIGSRLWMLTREKQSQTTLQKAQDYASEALQWLIDDGVIGKLEIYCEWSKPGLLSALITAYKNDGSIQPIQFDWAWQGLI